MTQLIIALWLALVPAHHHTASPNGNTHVTMNNYTGGETEPVPPPTPPHH